MSRYSLDARGLCDICRGVLVNFDRVYSFGSYEGALQRLIHLFKYGKVETLARPLGRLLIQAIPLDQRFDVIMAMPIHWRKRFERGFNQAELLARPVARRYGMKLCGSLRRKRYAKSQASLTEAQRTENLKDAFEVRNCASLAGKHVLLIDDVFTTGATLRAAAAALKGAGVARVSALTLARVDRGSSGAGPVSSPARDVQAMALSG